MEKPDLDPQTLAAASHDLARQEWAGEALLVWNEPDELPFACRAVESCLVERFNDEAGGSAPARLSPPLREIWRSLRAAYAKNNLTNPRQLYGHVSTEANGPVTVVYWLPLMAAGSRGKAINGKFRYSPQEQTAPPGRPIRHLGRTTLTSPRLGLNPFYERPAARDSLLAPLQPLSPFERYRQGLGVSGT